jgi:ribosomal protein S18 acetylase RimI-like enzyme
MTLLPSKVDPGMPLPVPEVTLGEKPITMEPAQAGDAAEILTLQKLAYRSEAELNKDFTIPPLTQTLEEIEAEFGRMLFLKATANGCIIGSVRAEEREGTCYIGRLIVHPDCQNRGIGRRLLAALEARFSRAARYELYTSERSARNLYLYQKQGYTIFRREPLSGRVTLVYLEKPGKGVPTKTI